MTKLVVTGVVATPVISTGIKLLAAAWALALAGLSILLACPSNAANAAFVRADGGQHCVVTDQVEGAPLATYFVAATIFLVLVLPLVKISWSFIQGVWRRKRNAADSVIFAWQDLRMSSTELIEGYSSNAPRRSLAGLTARVETSGSVGSRKSYGAYGVRISTGDDRLVHLTIEGPRTAIVRTAIVRSLKAMTEVGARQFASELNLAGRQLQGEPPTSAGTLTMPLPPPGRGNYNATRPYPLSSPPPPPVPPPSVPAAWYPDPNNEQLQRYWDGATWTEHTAPNVST
jgi:Protein of unknown function (DUF2510)